MIQFRSGERFEFVFSEDSAIDRKAKGFHWERFMKTGDRVHLPMRKGVEPTIFEVKRLGRRQYLHVLDQPRQAQASEAVALGLKGLRNARTAQGEELRLTFEREPGELGERLDEATIDRLFAADLFAELGAFIMMLSTVAKDPT